MKSVVDKLTRLIPPPAKPIAAVGDWAAVERDLGLTLPADYKAVVGTYGSGKFFEFVWVASPFVANPPWSLAYQLRLQAQNFRDYAKEGFNVAFPSYPDAGGLVCFGTTENCNCLSWLAKGAPDTWDLAIWDPLTMRAFPGLRLAGLLVQLAKGKPLQTVDGPLFPDDIFQRIYFTSEDYDTPTYGWGK